MAVGLEVFFSAIQSHEIVIQATLWDAYFLIQFKRIVFT